MADIADRAQTDIERVAERAAQHRRPTAPRALESANECAECGELIPSARQIAQPGCTMCVDCAAYWERRYRAGGAR